MATEYIDFYGTLAFDPRLVEPDEYMGDKKWDVPIILDTASIDKYRKSGIQAVPKEVNDGFMVRFRRPCKKLIKGELVEFSPPEVKRWDEEQNSYVDYEKALGKGSRVKVNVAVYDTVQGKGHRLQSVIVLDGVPIIERETTGVNTKEMSSESLSEVKEW